MREAPEVREAKSLKKEYDMFVRIANTPGIAQIEKDYYMKMANNTYSKIDSKALNSNKKKQFERKEYDEYR